MAKVVDPDESFKLYQSKANSLVLRNRKEGYTVSKIGKPTNVPQASRTIIEAIRDAKNKQWRELTDEQRLAWSNLAVDNQQTGYQLFFQEGWKQQLNSRYGYARYGQNVYLP